MGAAEITFIIIVSVAVIALAVIGYFGKFSIKRDIMLRVAIVYIILAALFFSVIYKVFEIQYIEGDKLRNVSKGTLTYKTDTIRPLRGNILSDDKRLLSSSIPHYYIYMDMRVDALKVKNKKTNKTYFETHVKDLALALSNKFKDRTPKQYENYLRQGFKKKRASLKLYPKLISHVDFLEVKEFPILKRGSIQGGFSYTTRIKRVRPFKTLASRTIGDIYGDGGRGKNGLEMYYDSVLTGEYGTQIKRKTAGKFTNIITKEPINGLDVVSTINIDLQEIAERELRKQLETYKAKNGTVVLMEVGTGEVKAITNLIRANNGNYYESSNIAVLSQIEPGSTFKTLSLMLAIEHGYIDTTTVVNTYDGSYKFADRILKDWNFKGFGKDGGFGKAKLGTVLAQSSNVGVAILIDKYYKNKPSQFINAIHETGLTKKIELEIPGHGHVAIKNPKAKNWWLTTLPWMSIGYESQVPPIHMLMFYNAIANNGKMIKPKFTTEILNNGVVQSKTETEVINEKICSDNTLGQIQDMLVNVVDSGTAKKIKSDLFKIAGKTGTSQIFEGGTKYNADGRLRHQITFAGYFPADKPLYSCIVYIREPNISSAGIVCGPVFKTLAEKAFILNAGHKIDNSSDTIKWDIEDVKVSDYYYDTDNIMPSVIGMTLEDALFILENKKLKVKTTGYGIIKKQSIEEGEIINPNSKVELVLSTK